MGNSAKEKRQMSCLINQLKFLIFKECQKMIKYVKIPGYVNLGESEMFSHLYQFKALEPDENNYYNMIFIWAYIGPATLWHGNILAKTKECIFVEKELDLKEAESMIGPIKIIRNFKEFIKNNAFESSFKDFTIKE
jgi:hypothetical protein